VSRHFNQFTIRAIRRETCEYFASQHASPARIKAKHNRTAQKKIIKESFSSLVALLHASFQATTNNK